MKKHTLFKRSAVAMALTATLCTAAHANNYSQIVIFGDSLSDTGRLKDIVNQVDPTIANQLQPSFVTNPDPVWSQVFASYYNHNANPNTNLDKTGTNYAVGGARSGEEANWNNAFTIPSTKTQISSYLNDTTGKTDPNALYVVWIGANDLNAAAQATSTAAAQAAIANAVIRTATDIETLNQLGATSILVPNIPDLSLTPRVIFGESIQPGIATKAQLAASLYNSSLYTALNQSTANIITANTFALLQEAVANKEAFGFKNTHGVACNMPNRTRDSSDVASTSLACTPAHFIEDNANETYVFADDIHPTGRTHRIIAQYYRSIIDAPQQVGQLPQKLLNVGTLNNQQLSRHIDRLNNDKHSVWADIHIADGKPTTTVGLDAAGQNSHFGLYVRHGQHNHQFGTFNSDVKNIGAGIYHRHDFGKVRLNANAGIDRLSIDSTRRIDWEGMTRQHHGEAAARRFYGGLQASYGIDLGKVSIRPHIGINTQQVKISSLIEDNAHLSTAMRFDRQEQKSVQGELGFTTDYAIKPNLVLTASINHAHEFNDDDRTINASLSSVREHTKGFNTTITSNKVHTTTAHLGIHGTFGATNIGIGAYTTHQDSKHDDDMDAGGYLSVSRTF